MSNFHQIVRGNNKLNNPWTCFWNRGPESHRVLLHFQILENPHNALLQLSVCVAVPFAQISLLPWHGLPFCSYYAQKDCFSGLFCLCHIQSRNTFWLIQTAWLPSMCFTSLWFPSSFVLLWYDLLRNSASHRCNLISHHNCVCVCVFQMYPPFFGVCALISTVNLINVSSVLRSYIFFWYGQSTQGPLFFWY